ncbi:hypothetical protein TNCT_251 [Trichonephila clavata]|uniref:Pre-C2HC domain-containing protein n=1 Tax=Trichonephila clavata TaxID=2740835 RepID=A0A8X6GSR9_TRICU|nr:hypothetical protein TNCT_251 [Trichonephila clavata]
MMEHLKGELASFYPFPNPNCHVFNRIPDLSLPADGVLSWNIIRGPDYKKPTTKTTNSTQNKSKKQTNKDSFTSPSKTKKLKITDHPNFRTDAPIELKNKYDALATSDSEPSTPAQHPSPPTKTPPIMLKYETTYTTLVADLLKKYPDLTFKLAGEFLKLFTTNTDNYRAITNYLTEKGQQYYDPPLASRPRKIVIKGLPISSDIVDIKKNLTEQCFEVEKVAQLTKSKTKYKLPKDLLPLNCENRYF